MQSQITPAPRVSIVIVSWNALETVKACLPSVVASDYPDFEILFADNASDDGTPEWIAENFPSVRIVKHPQNWAFCRGNNEAVRHATGKYVVLLNNDVEVPPPWLRPLVYRMESDERIAGVQPKLLQFDDRSKFEYAGGSGGFMDRFGFPFTRGRIFFNLEEDRGQYDDAIDIFWATGAAVMLRKDLFDEVGGLDERFVMHMEEIDLCWRLKRKGYRIVVEPDSRVFHIGGASLAEGSAQKMFLNYRNNLLMLFKNLPPRTFRRILAVRVLLDAVTALRSIVLLRPGEAWAIVCAYAGAHVLRSSYSSDETPASDDPPILPNYRGSIVIDYFLRNRKKFSDLPKHRFLDR